MSMFDITERASEEIREIMASRGKDSPVRIIMGGQTCGGTSLGLYFDEARENDHVFQERGLTFVVDPDLYEQTKFITVDYGTNPMAPGFYITSGMEEVGGCGACACSC
jgi:Fe-S cluster assembly iron-binding protein IscA